MKPLYKILIIIGIGVLVILGIYLGWRAITQGPEITEEPTPPKGEVATTPPEGIRFKKLSEETVFDFWVNSDTKEVFYFTPEGRVFSAKDGPDLEVSKQTIDALNFIEVGLKNQNVLAAFGDPKAPQWGIFDAVDRVWRPLPQDIINATWGENNESLIVVVKNINDLNLAEADITKSPPSYSTFLRDFRLKGIRMTLLSNNRLIISELPAATYAASLWQLNLGTLDMNLLLAPEKGFDIRWSKDKSTVFAWGINSGFLVLDENLQIILPTPFTTFPEKCTVDPQKIYCFVPQNIPTGEVLPDDYLLKKFYSIDDLVVLGIESGEITKALTSNAAGIPAIDAKNPQVLGNNLYFVNRYDNSLYELRF